MSDDVVIRAEGLGKKYVIGHEVDRQRSVTLRDALAAAARNAWRKTADMARGRRHRRGRHGRGVLGPQGRKFRGQARRGRWHHRPQRCRQEHTSENPLAHHRPDRGRYDRGRVASLLEVGTGFHPELTGRENIYLNGAILGMTRAEISEQVRRDRRFRRGREVPRHAGQALFVGMYVRLAFAVAAHLEPEILIVDEVLAVGDVNSRRSALAR